MSETTEVTAALGVLEHLDPNQLQLESNVRDEAALTKAFVANIAENGVLVPITAVRTVDGAVLVRTGQRRTLAAREAGLASIPVYVLPVNGEEPGARLVEQIVENDHRQDLTETQRVVGIQQLLDTGLSATKTAKKLSVPAATVKAAKTAAVSQTAMDALGSGQVSLDEAAVLAEFEGDERAVTRLLQMAGRAQFAHVVAQLREEQASAKALAVAEARYRGEGFTVLTDQPASFDRGYIPFAFLLKDGEPIEELTDPTPAHWALLLTEDSVFVNKDTGEPVDEADVDWDTEGHPDAEPEEGLLHFDKVTETTGFVPEYYCIDHVGAGLEPNERFVRFSGMGGSSDDGEAAPVLSQEDQAARQQAVNDARAEAEKKERRQVLALNKLGEAALTVRRDFVGKLLARKTAPKGAAIFVASALSRDGHLLTNYRADEIVAELLGVTHVDGYANLEGGVEKGIDKLISGLGEGGDGRAQVITLGLVLGALEGRTPKDAWRQTHSGQWAPRAFGARDYLGFLADNGYALSGVEQIITGARTVDEVYEQYLADKE